MKYAEDYIIEHADTFDWYHFECDMNHYSKDFIEQFKDEIKKRVWKNSKGEYHREYGPAVISYDGSFFWYLNGLLHRNGGPALYEKCFGREEWYLNGEIHRLDGPAIYYPGVGSSWWLNGKNHRLDGPSVIWDDGRKFWHINGIEFTEKEFNDRCNIQKKNIS